MRYKVLADVYEELGSTTKILEKTDILSTFLSKVPKENVHEVVLLLLGRVFPEWDSTVIGVGTKLVMRAIAQVSGLSPQDVEKKWKDIGDLGKVAEALMKKKSQRTLFSRSLDVSAVIKTFRKIAELEGAGTVDKKVSYLADLLSAASPQEAKYLIRTALEDLRIGVGSGVLRDSIARAFDVDKELVEHAYNVTTDFSSVAELAKKSGNRGLEKADLVVGQPIQVMLYQKSKGMEDAFKTVGKPAAVEWKYDGFRLQCHRKGSEIKLFTRRLDDVTRQFPDIVEVLRSNVESKDYLIDTEITGIDLKTGRMRPFQEISQRIRRKYGIVEMTKTLPVQVNCFDIVYLDGKNLIMEPFDKRRELLEKVVKPVKNRLTLAEHLITSDVKAAEKFYAGALEAGNEGVMVKNLTARYKPGSRVGYGVKVKPVMESLDLLIVGAEWGTGKRANWMSSFILACRNPTTGEYLEMGKMGTGIKEKAEMGTSFGQLTKLLSKDIISEKGRVVKVKPKIVVEVAYEEIQKSPTYASGFALRFPRLLKVRDDRKPSEADTIERVKDLYGAQRGRK